jgi:hypothetical protein
VFAASMTDALALYGAVVSTATVLVGYFTWRRTIQTRVVVKMRPMMLHDPDGPDKAIVIVEMINHSQHEIAVTHVSFQRGDTDDYLFIPRPFPVTEPIPIVIGPRRAKNVWVEDTTLSGSAYGDVRRESLRAHVATEDGRTFLSSPVVIADARGR